MNKNRVQVLHNLEKKLAYSFRDIDVLSTALTHRSYINENQQLFLADNERLEFLGDSVLGLCVSDLIIKKYMDSPEGDLTKIRAGLVNEKILAEIARGINLGECLLIGRGEENSGSRTRDSFLANALEAVLAAIYLDSDFSGVKTVVIKLIEPLLGNSDVSSEYFDYKTALQELCQRRYKTTPVYMVVGSSGPEHDRTFDVRVVIVNKLTETGIGKSKKEAEKQAAKKAWEKLRDEDI